MVIQPMAVALVSVSIIQRFNIMRDTLVNTYLDYVNNYLSISVYAEHNGLTNTQAKDLLDLARVIFQSTHPEA
jgi:hypothetical protein